MGQTAGRPVERTQRMDRTLERCMRLLERRVAALRMLASGLEDTCEAIADQDTNRLHQCLAPLDHLCTELRFLGEEASGLRAVAAERGGADPGGAPSSPAECLEALARDLEGDEAVHFAQLFQDMIEADHRSRQAGQVLTALLRRSRRSVSVLMNFHLSRSSSARGGETTDPLARPPLRVKA